MGSFYLNVTGNVNLTYEFTQNGYSVSVVNSGTPATTGSVSCTPAYVNQGGSATCTVTTGSSGNILKVINCSGTTFCPSIPAGSTSFTIPNIQQPIVIAPVFASASQYVISSQATLNGYISCDTNPVNSGGSTNCTVIPAAGYELSGVSCIPATTGCPASAFNTVATFTLSAITHDLTIAPSFDVKKMSVTVNNPAVGGTVDCGAPPVRVDYNGNVSCQVNPAPGYQLTALDCGGNPNCPAVVPGTAAFKVSYIVSDETLTPTFQKISYSVTVLNPADGGTVTCPTPVFYGDPITCTVAATAPYTLKAVNCTGVDCSTIDPTASSFTIQNPGANVVLSPVFGSPIQYAILIDGVTGGSVACDTNPVAFNGSSNCTVTPAPGYTLTNLGCTPAGTPGCPTGSFGTLTTFSLTGITANVRLSPTFGLQQYTVTVDGSDTHGQVSCVAAPGTVSYGAHVTCTVTPNAGYQLATLTCTNSALALPCPSGNLGSVTSFPLAGISGNVNVVPTFVTKAINITVVNPPNGAVVGSVSCGPSPVDYGTTVTCTVTSGTGLYTLGAVNCIGTTACNSVAAGASSFSLGAVQQDVTVVPVFGQVNQEILQIDGSTHGYVTCATNPVNPGASSTCAVSPATGYVLSNLVCAPATTGCPTSGFATVTGFTLNPINSDVRITPTFTTTQVTVTAATAANGTLTCGTPPVQVDYNGSVTCAVTPAPGYQLSGVTCGTAVCPASLTGATSFPVSQLTADTTVTPLFAPKKFSVTVVNPGNPALMGSVSCDKTTADYDSATSCAITNGTGGYLLTAVNCTGTTACGSVTSGPFTIANIQSDVVVSPVFALPLEYTIRISPTLTGSVSCATNPVQSGQGSSCTVTPAPGYQLSNFVCAPSNAGCPTTGFASVTSVPLTNLTTDITVTPTFTAINYAVTVDPTDSNGSVSCTPTSAIHGQSSNCTVTPNAGYQLATLTCTNGAIAIPCPSSNLAAVSLFPLANISGNVNVVPTFAKKKINVTVVNPPNGAVVGSVSCGLSPVDYGTTVACTVTSGTGLYTLSAANCLGTTACNSVTAGASSFSLGAVQQDVTVVPVFSLINQYTVKVDGSTHGYVTCDTNPVNPGGGSTCTVTPATGFVLSGLVCTPATAGCPTGNLSTVGVFTLSPINAPVTLTPTFTTTKVTVTAGTGANGTISCGSAPVQVDYNGSATCTVTPAAGYQLTGVTCGTAVCPSSVLGATAFPVAQITADTTVTPTFAPKTFSVTVVNPANAVLMGSVSCDKTTADYNGSTTCTVTNGSGGYLLTAVNCTGTTACAAVTSGPFTIANLQSDLVVSPVFALPLEYTIRITPTLTGTVSCATNPVQSGQGSTCTVTPAPGTQLSNFVCAPSNAGCPTTGFATVTSVALTNLTTDITLTPTFVPLTYAVTVDPTDTNGTVSCAPTSVTRGQNSSCAITPNTGYQLATLTCANGHLAVPCPTTNLASLSTLTLAGITGDVTVTPTYVKKSLTVTAIKTGTGTGIFTCPTTLYYGDALTCTGSATVPSAITGLDCTGVACPAFSGLPGTFTIPAVTSDAMLVMTIEKPANPCTRDAQCAPSGFCDVANATCVPVLPTPQGTCDRDAQCQSGLCDTATGLCEACASDAQCAPDGFCGPDGACHSKLPNPQGPCDHDAQCASGHCNPTTHTCTACTGDADCAPSGYCDAATGSCLPKLVSPQGPCTENGQCVSNHCDATTHQCSDCTSNADCAPDGYCMLPGGTCAPRKQAPQACASDAECASGLYCDPTTNRCTPQKKVPEACTNGNECASGLCDATTKTCACPAGQHDGGDGACVPRVTCAAGSHDAGNGQCVIEGQCTFGFTLDPTTKVCLPDPVCDSGMKNDGNGQCVPETRGCAAGAHDGGDGRCVPAGSCSAGYVLDGSGACVIAYRCGEGFHSNGATPPVCVQKTGCSPGYQSDGTGKCVPITTPPTCAAGYHDGGNGTCVAKPGCDEGFKTDADGECIPRTVCPNGKHDDGTGSCVDVPLCAAGFHEGGDGNCVSDTPVQNECRDDADCGYGGQCVDGLCAAPGKLRGSANCSEGVGATSLFGLALVALLGLGVRRRKGLRAGLLILAVGAILAPSAHADETARVDLQRFRPAMGPRDILGVESALTLGHLGWSLGAYGNYATNPLVLERADGSTLNVVKRQTALDFGASIGLFGWGELSVTLPVTLDLSPNDAVPGASAMKVSSAALPGLRIAPKVRFLDAGDFHFGLAVPIEIPFTAGNFQEAASASANPRILAEYAGSIRIAANAGVILRKEATFETLRVGNAFTYGLGAEVPLLGGRQEGAHRLDVLGSVMGEAGLDQSHLNEMPMEGLLALRWTTPLGLALTAGAGTSMVEGYGSPDMRLLAGLSYTPRSAVRRSEPTSTLAALETANLRATSEGRGVVLPVLGQVKHAIGSAHVAGVTPASHGEVVILPDGSVRYTPTVGYSGADLFSYTVADAEGRTATGKVALHVTAPPASPAPVQAPIVKKVGEKARLDGQRIVIFEQVYFATNRERILRQSFPLLQAVAQILRDNPQVKKVRVEGYTDSVGKPEKNLDLSRRRAAAVKEHLIGLGIDPTRLDSEGFGPIQPIADNRTSKGRALNRRVVFVVAE